MPRVRRQEDEARDEEAAARPVTAPPVAVLAPHAGNAAIARFMADRSTDEMIANARARETPDEREGVDPSEWDDEAEPEPESPIDTMIANARARETPDTREGVDPSEWEEPAPMTVSEPLAALRMDSRAAPGVWDSRQRAQATGQSVEDVRAPEPEPATPGTAWKFGQQRQAKFDRMLGAHAQAAAAHAEPDPGRLAAESLQAKKDKETELQAKRDNKTKHREDALRKGELAHRRHGRKPDKVAEGIASQDARNAKRHDDMVASDHLEASGYGEQRQRGYSLRQQLASASPFVTVHLRSTAQTLDSIVSAKPTKNLAGPKKQLDDADRAIQQALKRENDYKFVREKAANVLTAINSAGAAFKDRIKDASRKTAERYATGTPVEGKQIADAHSELNEAKADVDARAKDWEIAQRSRGTLATLKQKRAELGYIDAEVDRRIAASDLEDGRDDFWALEQSVKFVATEVERLKDLERDYQQLHQRLTYVLAQHPATVTPTDQATITDGFNNRATVANPRRAYQELHDKMKAVEAPTIQRDFHDERAAGHYATATASLLALVNNGVVRRGALHSVYTTSYDGDGFSAEFGVDGIPEIVIHSHCAKDGRVKDGTNASHWKPKSVKFEPGVSHPITGVLRDKLIDRGEIEARKNFNRQK